MYIATSFFHFSSLLVIKDIYHGANVTVNANSKYQHWHAMQYAYIVIFYMIIKFIKYSKQKQTMTKFSNYPWIKYLHKYVLIITSENKSLNLSEPQIPHLLPE